MLDLLGVGHGHRSGPEVLGVGEALKGGIEGGDGAIEDVNERGIAGGFAGTGRGGDEGEQVIATAGEKVTVLQTDILARLQPLKLTKSHKSETKRILPQHGRRNEALRRHDGPSGTVNNRRYRVGPQQ